MKLRWLIVPSVLLAMACSKAAPKGSGDTEAMAIAEESAPGKSGNDKPIKVALPQIAYVYGYSYSLPSDRIAAAQERHLSMCDRLGPARCHVLAMERAVDDQSSSASLKLAVDASIARAFGAQLTRATVQAGGKQSDASIEAEDLSKQIVDTEARLRSRQALADRLTTLLKTRNGPVADLVAAERSVADVQEEIDAAQSWLAEARGRISTSTIAISYTSSGAAGEGFLATLSNSASSMLTFFGQSLSTLIMLLAILLPWAALLCAGLFGGRYLKRRFWPGES